jgi:site-specific DNA-methyltransferase (cytosine-N4-specific)
VKVHPLVCQIKAYIQPFEQVLAIKELEALSGATVHTSGNGPETVTYRVETEHAPEFLADRLTYWEKIYTNNPLSNGFFTRQVKREATANLARNGISLERLQDYFSSNEDIAVPNRRNLRYGSHGIHEYRGKFFPQLVRSLLNISQVDSEAIVLDPMCGSGTTPVEASLLGCQAIGVDFNPLSMLMSRAKSDILTIPPGVLLDEYQSLCRDLEALETHTGKLTWFESLPKNDQVYLHRWFAPEALAALDPIMVRIQATSNPACRALFIISLSNILRAVSWQKTDDLRVRKDKQNGNQENVKDKFIHELVRSVKSILAFLYQDEEFQTGDVEIIQGDARRLDRILAHKAKQIDVIITSPPYATALPYLDTDRLSLSYLKLLPRAEHRQRDYGMIGNREINKRRKKAYWEEYLVRRNELPSGITNTIEEIKSRNEASNAGFRRQNLPALLARYFFDMLDVLIQFRYVLKENAPAYVVVGNNHTIAGGKRIEIETDDYLGKLGQVAGLKLEDVIPMEMLVSRDIFKKNTGTKESILCFRNPIVSPHSL